MSCCFYQFLSFCQFIKSLRPTPDSNWTLEFQESVKYYDFPLEYFPNLHFKFSLLY